MSLPINAVVRHKAHGFLGTVVRGPRLDRGYVWVRWSEHGDAWRMRQSAIAYVSKRGSVTRVVKVLREMERMREAA